MTFELLLALFVGLGFVCSWLMMSTTMSPTRRSRMAVLLFGVAALGVLDSAAAGIESCIWCSAQLSQFNYPVRVYAQQGYINSMRLVASVCALPPKNLLLSVICCLLFEFKRLQCSLLRPASYSRNTRRLPRPRNIFFSEL